MDAALRQLGRSGLRVSPISVGCWLTFGVRFDAAYGAELIRQATQAGVVMFDTAAGYGPSEEVLGAALERSGVCRDDVVISTKLFPKRSLSRKHVTWTIEQSLRRLRTPFVDIVCCHRFDPTTPLVETVRTMSDLISSGRAHYWGTSHWTAAQIVEAIEIADRYQLHPPVAAQPGYSLGQRRVVEQEYADLVAERGHGLMTYSPLGFGLLTARYVDGVPPGSRAGVPGQVGQWLVDVLSSAHLNARVRTLRDLADAAAIPITRLALAWCLRNRDVSTVITAPETVEELHDSLGALSVQLDDALAAAAENLFAGTELEPEGI